MIISPIQQAFLKLSIHSKIHYGLRKMDRHYRDALEKIEKKEILAYDDDKRYEKLEQLKSELLEIRFIEKKN